MYKGNSRKQKTGKDFGRLITQRSQVQILPPQPIPSGASRSFHLGYSFYRFASPDVPIEKFCANPSDYVGIQQIIQMATFFGIKGAELKKIRRIAI